MSSHRSKNSNSKQSSWLDEDEIPSSLSSGFPDNMVILDCETTGGKASYHRIIEVGLLIVEKGRITERWTQYVNPETHLPAGIIHLTGIKPVDVSTAPVFADIADELFELIQGRVLVAHNARFDYAFLKNEFDRAGFRFNEKPLCSVKFSRAMFPQFRRHGLDAIIKRFEFSIENRHRAQDDAEMVFQLFQKSTQLFSDEDIRASCEKIMKRPTLPVKLDPKEIEKLPSSAGVYYFYDDKSLLLYVGKSVNIRNRVLNHFSQDYKNHKDLKMSARIAHIDFTQTPADFGAQLLESQQIKKLKPLMNVRLRRVKKLYQLQLQGNATGYLVPEIHPVETDAVTQQSAEQFGLFRSPRQITKKLEKLADQFFLCHQLLGLEPGHANQGKACFRFQLKRCFGACCQQELPEVYNERISTALKQYQTKVWPWNSAIVVEEKDFLSKESDEKNIHYHLIDNWVYLARISTPDDIQDYGYTLSDSDFNQHDFLQQAYDNQPIEEPIDSCLKVAEHNTFLQEHENTIQGFDLDMYFILVRFLFDAEKIKLNGLKIIPLNQYAQN